MRHSGIQAAWRGVAACQKCGIRDLVLFADLQEEDFNLIHLPIEEVGFRPGEALYHARDEAGALYTVREGLVKLAQYLPDGTQRIVRLLRKGDTAGLEITVGRGDYEHDAVAVQPVLACRIPRQVVDRLSRETPRLHSQLLKRWHQAVHQADEWLTELSTGSARERLARLLLQLADANGEVRLFSREDVGAMLGLTTETASRTVAEFKRAGLIQELGPNHYRCAFEALEEVATG